MLFPFGRASIFAISVLGLTVLPLMAELSPATSERVQTSVVLLQFGEGYGSGFFLGPDGLIITAAHIVEPESNAVVVFSDGREGTASFISFSPLGIDLAVLQLEEGRPDAFLELSEDTHIRPGRTVYAVGNPHPIYPSLISRGTIGYHHLRHQTIIHDANISKGSSGGPLLLADGSVVGVVVEMLSQRDQDTMTEYFSGYHLAVDLRAIEQLLEAIEAGEREWVQTGHLSYLEMPLPVLPVNTLVVGDLHDRSDRLPSDLSYANGYHFDLEAGKTYEIALKSDDFDAYLMLFDSMVELIDENDDAHGETTDAGILFTPARSARYTAVVTTFSTGETGSYRFSIEEVRTETVLEAAYELDTSHLQASGGQYYRELQIEGKSGQSFIVSMSSDAIDSYLEIYDPEGILIAENDDWSEATGLDAKVKFRLTEALPFSVRARTFAEGETGPFTLTIERRLE